MKLSDFMYNLPEERIAQTPMELRDHSRLMVLHRDTHEIEHRHFFDVIGYLNAGDVLVINETKVIPARLYGEKLIEKSPESDRTGHAESEDAQQKAASRIRGAACEVLLLRQLGPKRWETLVRPGKKLKPGARIVFGQSDVSGPDEPAPLQCRIVDTTEAGGRIVEFECEGSFEAALDALGEMPLPPYIHEKLADRNRYQTVYAKQEGSAAAPTAGLHFTPELLQRIRAKGVEIVPVLLHVGLGTFRPVKVENIEEHEMHTEYFEVTPEAAEKVNAARARGNRVIAVGTTSVRTLESAARDGKLIAMRGETNIFIRPGYRFQLVDALITNFHLPGSTLIMLVSALYDREHILEAYRTAVEEQYRFFSFGDAMLIE